MRKSLYIVAMVAACLLLSTPITAQTSPSAEGRGISFWVGVSVSTFNPDYGCNSSSPFACWEHHVIGLGPYVDTSPFLLGRIGVEAEARFLRWHGPAGLTEDNYLAGPRVRLFRYRGMLFTGKVLLGRGHLDVRAPAIGSGYYFAYAPGAAIDYRVAKRLSARFDYEYQRWPGFQSGGLTPNGFTVGVSYALR